MITIFVKIKNFWRTFWHSLSNAYSRVFRDPVPTKTQPWRDTSKLNLLAIVVNKLNNLTNTEATFEVSSDSKLADQLKDLCKDLQENRFEITEQMLGLGDFFVFPATGTDGKIVHSYIPQENVRILMAEGNEIKEVYGIVDTYTDKNGIVSFLTQHHSLAANGDLAISFYVLNDKNELVDIDKWEELNGVSYLFKGANHIGIGRYKSPVSSRGDSPVYGVPLNYGCFDIEEKIFNDLEMIEKEFENAKSVIITDPRNVVPDEEAKRYRIKDNILPMYEHAGSGSVLTMFNPAIRESEHFNKLVNDLGLYEKAIGTSKGILTDNESTFTATATAVKRANSDTLALLDRIRDSIDKGNVMTLEADAIFLNIRRELWSYSSDWFDPFEDPMEQWQRLLEAKQSGIVEKEDLLNWLFPSLTDEEVAEKIERLKAEDEADTNAAIERMLGGGA